MDDVVRLDAHSVRCEVSYGPLYRFRLWLAIVDDMALRRMGVRAYLSHIDRVLRSFTHSGTEILNTVGAKISINDISSDDLFGFLGKKEDEPSGPQRWIDNSKIAVLDVYFKLTFPLLAAAFGKQVFTFEMSAILTMFFTVDNKFVRKVYDKIEEIKGVYVACPLLKASSVRMAITDGRGSIFTVSVFVLAKQEGIDHLIVHKLVVPFDLDDIRGDYRGL